MSQTTMLATEAKARRSIALMTTVRTRREPPKFRVVEVSNIDERSRYLSRVTLTGSGLLGFEPGLPASSVRLLLPWGTGELVLPTWSGNVFLMPDGERATIRTLTPLRFNPDLLELDVEVVRHPNGPLSAWVESIQLGDRCAISGPGRGYEIDPLAGSLVLAGDESALPAIGTILDVLSSDIETKVFIEIGYPEARIDLSPHQRTSIEWLLSRGGDVPGDGLVTAISGLNLTAESRIWAAGEAAAMQRIRRMLFKQRGVARANAVIRGYWKYGRN